MYKHTYLMGIVALGATALLGSCTSELEAPATGEATLYLNATVNDKVQVVSRADDNAALAANAMVWISNDKGVVRQYASLADVPDEGIKLSAGNYVAEAWAGDSVPASFTDRYFTGIQPFTLANGDLKAVEVSCKIANVLVAVSYSDELDGAISGFEMTVGHSQGKLTFEGRDERVGYFMLNSRDHDLQWTLTATLANGNAFSRSGVIAGCKKATRYNLNVGGVGELDELGGAYFTVDIDETAVYNEEEVVIVPAPDIRALGFDINAPIRSSKGQFERHSFWISGYTAELPHVLLTSDAFVGKFGLEHGVNDFDIIGMTDDAVRAAIQAAGITWQVFNDADKQASAVKVSFEEEYLNALEDGEYTCTIAATDANGKTATHTFTVNVSDAPVVTAPVVDTEVYATRAVIYGEIVKEDAVNARLQYRASGESAWTDAATTVAQGAARRAPGQRLTAVITGLKPGTVYEYRAVADGYEGPSMTFATEAALQLPNAGFEFWSADGKVVLPAPSLAEKFWDSGNYGSATMNKNITDKASSPVHSGSYSAQLKSQFVGVGAIGKFAAGNVFVGEYLKTDGTDGVLGWGRAFTSRPAKLHGWVKYAPGTAVDKKGAVSGYLNPGDLDKGTVYIALLDDSKMEEFEGKRYPVVVKTKSSQRRLFSKDDANVVAYGQVIFDQATEGDGLQEFTVNLEYKDDRKASYILCTASASLYGDYFCGGEGSTMWLDDLELIYE